MVCLINNMFEDIDDTHMPEKDMYRKDLQFNYDFDYGGYYD